MTFGDDDPEDGWDADDPPDVKLGNLRRRLQALEASPRDPRTPGRVAAALVDLDATEPAIPAFLAELRSRLKALR